MNEPYSTRNDLLSTLYCLLPNIDDDYAARLVYHLEKTHTLGELTDEINELKKEVTSSNPMVDTIIAKILLDEITLQAGQLQLRIYNNALAISELTTALHTPNQDTQLLLNCYASFGTPYFFDEQFTVALKDVLDLPDMSDEEKARHAMTQLLTQARTIMQQQAALSARNKQTIYQIADQYHLSVRATAELLSIYTREVTLDFETVFGKIFAGLEALSTNTRLNASLASRVLRYQMTEADAQQIAKTSLLLKYKILEEDLVKIACRYLRRKTSQDIVDAFEAVLKRLPHINQKEENLGLAVQVLLDGTEDSFTKAQQEASSKRERELLYKALSKQPIFSGYEKELAQKFGGVKTIVQLEHSMQDLLPQFPYHQTPAENKELACQVLLGTLSTQQAWQQAAALRDKKALQATQQSPQKQDNLK